MDNYKGDNYEIIVDDAFKYLAKYAEEKKTFDVIFGDLTDIPIHTGGSTWNFVKAVIKSSLRLLPVGEFIVKMYNPHMAVFLNDDITFHLTSNFFHG